MTTGRQEKPTWHSQHSQDKTTNRREDAYNLQKQSCFITKDFWGDLVQLDHDKNHYANVLTLEDVPKETVDSWHEDSWIINAKGYYPYYLVDGQQRLTTAILLIQAILDTVPEDAKLNFTSKSEIRKKFIFESKDDGLSRSYIFGYEKDNPSYEFLKTKIFGEVSDNSFTIQDTVYTKNLEQAKGFFLENLKALPINDIEILYKKLTQQFLFNIYTISSDIDVHVAFETMNNRGKPLSHLELLKNRLIYLSTRFDEEESDRKKLRHAVNESWKSVYHYLGKSKDNPLDDDVFLRTHFLLYYGHDESRGKIAVDSDTDLDTDLDVADSDVFEFAHRSLRHQRGNYKTILLQEVFTPKNVVSGRVTKKDQLSIKAVYNYVQSLKHSVEIWYQILNPNDSAYSSEENFWLEKLNRLNIMSVAPLILAAYHVEKSPEKRVQLLTAIDRYMFIRRFFRFAIEMSSGKSFIDLGIELYRKGTTTEKIIKQLEGGVSHMYNDPAFHSLAAERFKRYGYYNWEGLGYLLFEYELELKKQSKNYTDRLNWDEFQSGIDQRDHASIEHIYPQAPKKLCWTDEFRKYNAVQRGALKHSLGNLVAVSKPKNSSFSNKCFTDKKGDLDSMIGFKYGSYSEMEVAQSDNWTAIEITRRGLKILDFIEQRWDFSLGDRTRKLDLLGLSFVPKKEGGKID